jgi:protocatechuate 4,5-dioxygenase alpha subunit
LFSHGWILVLWPRPAASQAVGETGERLPARVAARRSNAKEIGGAEVDDVIAGSLVFTGERSAQSFRLNKMAATLRSAEARARFQADEAAYMREHGCTEHEIALVQERDWKAMMAHGASIYLLLKIGAAVGHALPQIGAHTSGRGG